MPKKTRTPEETLERELKKALQDVTDGPWDWGTKSQSGHIMQGAHLGETLISLDDTYENSDIDCNFVSASRDLVPRALDMLVSLRKRLKGREDLIEEAIHFLDSTQSCTITTNMCSAKLRVMRLAKTLRDAVTQADGFQAGKGLKAAKATLSMNKHSGKINPTRVLTREESGWLTKLIYDMTTETDFEPDFGLGSMVCEWGFESPLRHVIVQDGISSVFIENDPPIYKHDTTGVEAYMRYCLRTEISEAWGPWR